MKGLKAATGAAALIATPLSAMPAQAQFHGPSRGDHHDRHRHEDKIDAGDVILGAVLAGGLIALFSGKKHQTPPEAQPIDVSDTDATPPAPSPEDQAVNACAQAAEDNMDDNYREARVERIASVTPREQGGFKVKGDIRVADESKDGHVMHFTCTAKPQGVTSVTVTI